MIDDEGNTVLGVEDSNVVVGNFRSLVDGSLVGGDRDLHAFRAVASSGGGRYRHHQDGAVVDRQGEAGEYRRRGLLVSRGGAGGLAHQSMGGRRLVVAGGKLMRWVILLGFLATVAACAERGLGACSFLDPVKFMC